MTQRTWLHEKKVALERLKEELALAYPTLHVYLDKEWVKVQGSFPIEEQGQEIDRFKVRIWIPPNFPQDPPRVFEIGGRIPRVPDRHVYTNGQCCLFFSDAFRIRHPNGMQFLDFLRGPVRDYFLGQIATESGQSWPFGQLGHSKQGVFEFYEEELQVTGQDAVLRYLACVSYETLKGHHKCPCGSGLRLRDCQHRTKVDELRTRIPRDVALGALKRLNSQGGQSKSIS